MGLNFAYYSIKFMGCACANLKAILIFWVLYIYKIMLKDLKLC
ncbi:putative membrane protein [Moraxella catarrhalis]|uniref:Membrane protein n=1 Tax=Moraxella catarrhalis TaxID=480 RepID=A0A3Q9GJ16_MORCA|nr:putative membrane protein [Moraxella catarrhalis BBH18]AZQ87188.1 putative membrane protein [Moraxella catarrhalis]EKF84189.1 hypothetical protein MCRH_0722 [Moraxella catarrhalis RH4]AZQ88558.1 putative membrane protein [Moraxella catarrhalis]AZQ91549.1 putative membrane protein [Moraxella catarrhalis]